MNIHYLNHATQESATAGWPSAAGPDRVAPYGMTPADLLLVCGPSWTSMSPEQRARYGPPLWSGDEAPTIWTIAGLCDLVREFPRAVRTEGLARVARRWGATSPVVALAERVDRLADVATPTLRPVVRTLIEIPSAPARSLAVVPSKRPRSLLGAV